MFNTPILDIAIGLIFIFLLYSLLATSIKEAIATGLSLRARMLRKGIVVSMLSDSKTTNKWVALLKGLSGFAKSIVSLIAGHVKKPDAEMRIGEYFYDHPIIKNYGSSGLYPYPSYIPTSNFAVVLIDVLKKDFDKKKADILKYKALLSPGQKEAIERDLNNATSAIKINELLKYYAAHYDAAVPNLIAPENLNIDEDTLRILHLYFESCVYNVELFGKKLENWFDESMNRVSGWYKRQAQYILFIIGFGMAMTFNVDVIDIGKRLSRDKDLRDQLVKNAIDYSSQHQNKDTLKVLAGMPASKNSNTAPENADTVSEAALKKNIAQVNNIAQTVEKNNSLIAIGWDNQKEFNAIKEAPTRTFRNEVAYSWRKIKYVIRTTFASPHLILSFIILAIAVSLGAPFWFDMLSKIISIRGSGKPETPGTAAPANTATTPVAATPDQKPVNINLNPQNSQEAVG